MKTCKKIGLGLLFIIVIFGVWFYPKYKILGHTMYLFDENNIVTNFRSFDSIWPISTLEASSKKYMCPKAFFVGLPSSFEFMAIGIYNQNIYINPKYNDTSYVPSSDYAALELYRTISIQLINQ